MNKRYLLILIFIRLSLSGFASHLLGGQLFYDFIGNNTYRITDLRYINCNCPVSFPCPIIEDSVFIHFFDSTGNYIRYKVLKINRADTLINSTSGSCKGLCMQKAWYSDTIQLPSQAGGYTMVYQRCCRTPTITSIASNSGSTYYGHLPDPGDSLNRNSSARFDSILPSVIVVDSLFSFIHSATDPDGDSLVYSFTDVLDGADVTCVDPNPFTAGPGCPTQPPPPPYSSVIYLSPFSSQNPTNNPSDANNLRVDSITGRIYGVPNQEGAYMIGMRVDEIRNGYRIGSTYEDFQIVTKLCGLNIGIQPTINPPDANIYTFSSTLIVDFQEASRQRMKLTVYNMQGQQLAEDSFDAPGIYTKDLTEVATEYIVVKLTGSDLSYSVKKLLIH